MRGCVGVAVGLGGLMLTGAAPAPAATYHVSARGHDSSAGSQARPWRTVARVNRQRLAPGDRVLFNAHHVFDDAVLKPANSGAAGRPIVYGSYGSGRATVPRGVYLNSVSHLRYQDLVIRGAANAVLASVYGAPVRHISLVRNTILDAGFGINSNHPASSDWTIRGNTIRRTGNSGMFVKGDRFTIECNLIADTGNDSAVAYPKHGLYVKASNTRIISNTIEDFSSSGVSLRGRNSVVKFNTIAGGPVGIGWFQEGEIFGSSYWRNNRISSTTSAAMLVTPKGPDRLTGESFTITGNAMNRTAGRYLSLAPTRGTYAIGQNRRVRAPLQRRAPASLRSRRRTNSDAPTRQVPLMRTGSLPSEKPHQDQVRPGRVGVGAG